MKAYKGFVEVQGEKLKTPYIIDIIGNAACLEQLAEECAKLAQAALKMARLIRKENPTPVTYNKAIASLTEEIADVRLCIKAIERNTPIKTKEIEDMKLNRWYNRITKTR